MSADLRAWFSGRELGRAAIALVREHAGSSPINDALSDGDLVHWTITEPLARGADDPAFVEFLERVQAAERTERAELAELAARAEELLSARTISDDPRDPWSAAWCARIVKSRHEHPARWRRYARGIVGELEAPATETYAEACARRGAA